MRALPLIRSNTNALGIAEQGLKDSDPGVLGAAALSLGVIKFKSAIPHLIATGKSRKEGTAVTAAAKALIELGDEKDFEVYFAVLTRQRTSGETRVGSREEKMKRSPEPQADPSHGL